MEYLGSAPPTRLISYNLYGLTKYRSSDIEMCYTNLLLRWRSGPEFGFEFEALCFYRTKSSEVSKVICKLMTKAWSRSARMKWNRSFLVSLESFVLHTSYHVPRNRIFTVFKIGLLVLNG